MQKGKDLFVGIPICNGRKLEVKMSSFVYCTAPHRIRAGSCTLFLKFMNFSQFSGKIPEKVGKSGEKWGNVGKCGEIINLALELLRKRRNAEGINLYSVELLF